MCVYVRYYSQPMWHTSTMKSYVLHFSLLHRLCCRVVFKYLHVCEYDTSCRKGVFFKLQQHHCKWRSMNRTQKHEKGIDDTISKNEHKRTHRHTPKFYAYAFHIAHSNILSYIYPTSMARSMFLSIGIRNDPTVAPFQ